MFSAHSSTRGTRAVPLCVGYVSSERMFSLSRSLPSSLSANDIPFLFERFIGTTPRCDSSQTYTRAVWPEPSPAVLAANFRRRHLRGLPVLVHEVSRRAWGLRLRRTEQELALALLFIWPSAHLYRVGVRIVCFRSSIAHPAYPLSTLHCVPHGSSARLEAEWIATPFS
jgi:hypothetical protein